MNSMQIRVQPDERRPKMPNQTEEQKRQEEERKRQEEERKRKDEELKRQQDPNKPATADR
jgi:hypothetical protein